MNRLIEFFNEKYGDKYGKISYPRTTLQIYRVYQSIKSYGIKDEELVKLLHNVKLPNPKSIEEKELYTDCLYNKDDSEIEIDTNNLTTKEYVDNSLKNKVDKVTGKGLSTVDFTKSYETKLKGLENYNDAKVKKDIETINTQLGDIAKQTITTEERTKLTNLKNYDDTEIKNNIQTQKARIDSFTSLKEGSTTGDAELIDARVGADGVTYDNLGNAMRTQLGQFKDKWDKFILPFTYTANGYITYSNGNVTSYEGMSYTNFIDIEGITHLDIFNLNYTRKDSAGLGFYDINKNFLQGYQYDHDVNISLEIPKSAKYIRLSLPDESINKLYIMPNIVKELQQELTSSTKYELVLTPKSYIQYTSGVVVSHDTLNSSNFIALNKAHTKLYVNNLNYPATNFAGLSFYDINKNFLQGYQYKNDINIEINIPIKAYYVRLTTARTSVTIYSTCGIFEVANKNCDRLNDLENTVDKMSSADNCDYCQIFHKIAGVGDSLMSGELAYYNESQQQNKYIDCYKYSWLSNLCKNIGAEAVHYSCGGRTTKTWLADYLDKLKAETVKPSAYFVALGTNDTSHVELGTVEDCGTTNETFYGMYSKILNEIKQFNPNAKIFCFSLYFDPTSNTVQNYCKAIKTMSDKYGCYYVDFINTYQYFTSSSYVSVGHFTAPGYVRVGKQMQILINDIIRKNLNDFNFIGINYRDI